MKNLQRLLIAAAFASMMPSTIVLCSEESTETSTKPLNTTFLANFATVLAGSHGFIAGAHTMRALTKVKKNLVAALDHKAYSLKEEAVMKQLTKSIQRNKALMGVSCLVIAAPVIIPAAVDKINAINTHTEINKELDKETV